MIDASTAEARERLAAALGARRWVDEVAAAGPYESLAAMIEAGDAVARTLTDAELDEASSARPDADDPASDDGAGVHRAAVEQAGLERAAEGLDAAVARGGVVYEERFGRPFVIRVAGRSRQEVLDELQRRLKNDPREEGAEVGEQLRQIAALRLESLFGGDG